MINKKFIASEPWASDEVSTRNCFNCLAPSKGQYVSCRKGHEIETSQRKPITYNYVVKNGTLIRHNCQGCADFDNHWE